MKNKRKKTIPLVKQSNKTLQTQFAEIEAMIHQARQKIYTAANIALVELYWHVGKYVSHRVASSEWGSGTVDQLAGYLQNKISDLKGFDRRGLYRMKQFFETYEKDKKVSPLVTQIPWTNHLLILSKTRSSEEREFYLRLCAKSPLPKRQLERLLNTAYFERAMIKPKLSPLLRELMPQSEHIFKDSYSLEFLGLSDKHSEKDLQQSIVSHLKDFIIEFGRDFSFIGQEYRVQVGNTDFFLDLLFFHRELQCLIALELKINEFKPEYLGKMNFYLEALDRDVKKTHEKPSIGMILCKGKNDEVVEYALSRNLSPLAIADYKTKLPDKKLLQEKLHEFYELGTTGYDREKVRPPLKTNHKK